MSWLRANEPDGALPRSWYAETAPPIPRFPPLPGALRCGTAVIGAGYTGLSAALHLAQAGHAVTVLEAAQVGFGASGRNGGQVGTGFNWSPERLEVARGAAEARALWALTEEAKALTRHLIAVHAPEAGYRPGIVHAVRDAAGLAEARAGVDWLADRYGYAEGSVLNREALAEATGTRAFAGATLDMGAGVCQPLAYARGLAQAAVAAGAVLHEGTAVQRLVPGPPHRLETAQGTVTADRVVVAVNGYVDGLHPRLADHVLPINNYIAVTEPLGDRAPLTRPWAVADDRFVVNYWWQSRDGRLVYGGGESYGQRFPRDIAGKVRANLARIYPRLRDVRFTHAWGGTLAVTASRLPFVAELAPGLLAAGGYSGHGVALATLSGRAMARQILGDGAEFARLAALPVPRLPGGRWLGPLLTNGGMMALALRDRLGL